MLLIAVEQPSCNNTNKQELKKKNKQKNKQKKQKKNKNKKQNKNKIGALYIRAPASK